MPAQDLDPPAVDLVTRLEQLGRLGPVHELAHQRGVAQVHVHVGLRQTVLEPEPGEALHGALRPPRAAALLVVLPPLEHRRARQRGDIARAADVIRMHVRHEDALDRRVELVEHRPPQRLGVGRAEPGVDERPPARLGAEQVAVHVVDPERESERDLADAVENLLHV
jgi:hypothetical protein